MFVRRVALSRPGKDCSHKSQQHHGTHQSARFPSPRACFSPVGCARLHVWPPTLIRQEETNTTAAINDGMNTRSLPLTPPSPGETIVHGTFEVTCPFFEPSNEVGRIPVRGVNMTSRKLLPSILLLLFGSLFVGAYPAVADSSHARIIRLSLVQGDVRFARETHGDPLADANAGWETAGLNLPIRQGYVLATDNGRAEVEFENGAMAFLKENTVLEFYDLSLNDAARTTRLVLRQGSASFHVNPLEGDYFSVTGGDFTVEV